MCEQPRQPCECEQAASVKLMPEGWTPVVVPPPRWWEAPSGVASVMAFSAFIAVNIAFAWTGDARFVTCGAMFLVASIIAGLFYRSLQ